MGEQTRQPESPKGGRLLSRREVLGLAGAGGIAAAGYIVVRSWPDDSAAGTVTDPAEHEHQGSGVTTGEAPPVSRPDNVPSALWSDPATWGGQVPGRGDVAVVDQPILLDVDARVAGVTIEPAGDLVFDPAASRRLASTGNIVVRGRLQLHPGDHRVTHIIEFLEVDEGRFQGGHTDGPIDDDVGLWVVDAGVLDARGTAKRSWTNLSGAADAGDRRITVADASEWQVGDEIVITPTEPPTVEEHWVHHDRLTVAAINGNEVELDGRLEFSHPTVTVRPGVTHTAEVLNLTRNVLIQGTPDGRSHVIVNQAREPQSIAYVGLRHMGPRQGEEEVLGRYAIHFHANDNGSRGSVVEGVVAYDSTGHGFAAHLSNGVTFRESIAHDMVDDAFWWDLSLEGGRDLVPSDDIIYERCVASFVKSGGNSRFNLTGFLMGAGQGNIARGNVATGVEGGAESSAGFHWPSHSRDDNTWTMEDNIAHNNRHSGIYFWQNGAPRTIVTRFTTYHCGQGIFAGSYANLASYRDCTIYACENVGLVISATPARRGRRTGETITYEGMYIDQAELSDYAVEITKHVSQNEAERVTLISGGSFQGGRQAQLAIPEGGNHAQFYEVVDCTFDGNEFWLADGVPADSAIRVEGGDGTFVLRPADQPGDYRPEWNAVVSDA